MTEKIINILMENFDIRKINGTCNIKGCDKTGSGVIFREIYLKRHKNKEIAKFYICKEHLTLIKPLLKELNEISIKEGKVIKVGVEK